MVLNNRETKDKLKSYIRFPYSPGKRHLRFSYSVFVTHKIFRDVILWCFFFLVLVILPKLKGVNMDKSYWTTAPNVH